MSITTKTPKLIPIAAAVIVLLVIVFGLAQCGSDAPAPRIAADKQTGLSRAEGDTPAEVLARVSLRQSEYESGTRDMQRQVESLQSQIAELLKKQQTTPGTADGVVTATNVPTGSRPVALDQVQAAEVERLKRELEEKNKEVDRLRGNRGTAAGASSTAGSDIPPEFGYDKDQPPPPARRTRSISDIPGLIAGSTRTAIGSATSIIPGATAGDWIVVRPLDAPDGLTTAATAVTGAAAGIVSGSPAARGLGSSSSRSGSGSRRTEDEAVSKVYTIPANATLLGATSMTAIIGRIPTSGQVSDPYPFKIITGPENLATNGIEIPGLEGMVWQGTAVGDWGLGCVRGTLEQVTFTFEDGTIRTVDQQSARRDSGSQSRASGDSLGWISDDRGICVQGERITNAAPILAARTGVAIFDAAATALARAETTTSLSAITGAGSEYLTGDVARYAGFSGLGAGADDLKRWLDQRLNQIFDAVYAPPGQPLTVHTNIEIAIDYDPIGRKVDHEQVAAADRNRPLD